MNATQACAMPTRVVRATHLCREHVELELSAAAFPPSAPGQFLELLCRPARDTEAARVHEWPADRWPALRHLHDDAERGAYLRRPFSIADRFDAADGVRLVVISRAIGPGTRWLDALRAGDTLDVTGPLGCGFVLPVDVQRPLILVGGGVGIPPLIYLSRVARARGYSCVVAVFGAQTRDLMPVRVVAAPSKRPEPTACAEIAGSSATPAVLTTDDGTLGVHGRVTDALGPLLSQLGASKTPLVLTCGPDRMLHAVAKLTRAAGVDCQLCIEKPMGCGMATCLSCVVRLRDAAKPAGWRWALTCTEGPVFERDVLPEFD